MRLLLATLLALAAPIIDATPRPAAAAASASPPAANAPRYTHAAGSTLSFASNYDGEAFTGRFTRFSTQLAFDPATARGRFDVVIQLASADTGNEERDEILLGTDFFNSAVMPQARYRATRFRKLAGGRFVADGQLSLRSVTRPVPLTFTWTPGAAPVLVGSATVPRLAFGVGTGDWGDTTAMPDAVAVRTRLVLRPRP